MNRSYRLLSSLRWYLERLNLLTGIATLGAATAILLISGKGRTENRNSEVSIRLIPLILAALSLLFLTNRHERASERPMRNPLERPHR